MKKSGDLKSYIILSLVFLLIAGAVFGFFSSFSGFLKNSPLTESERNVVFGKTIDDLKFPTHYNEPLTFLNNTFSIKPLKAEAARVLIEQDKKVARYVSAYSNADVVQTKYSGKLKEDIILKKAGHPEEFAYEIDAAAYDFSKDKDGNFVFYQKGKNGNELYRILTIPAPFMIDADNKKSSTSDVASDLTADGKLTIRPSQTWLKNAKYPVTLDPTVEINIINIHSHPEQGENWTVNFTTLGQADLKIIPTDQATIDDDEFISLSCGDKKINPQILTGDVIYYPDWSCSEMATVIHNTKKAGNHTLRFEFGDQAAYAYNSNTTIDLMEYSTDANAQTAYISTGYATPTGGTITTDGSYTVHTFTTGGTFTSPRSGNVSTLVVGGGGGGGGWGYITGGGGAGGVVYNSSFGIANQSYTVTVGNGGSSNNNGQNSVFSTITAVGGGSGAADRDTGGNGGSGGGASYNGTRGTGTSGQGNDGGTGGGGILYGASGGGGGAGAAGVNGIDNGNSTSQSGAGGAGVFNNIRGTSAYYGGGGGGGSYWANAGAGGIGGGGNGGGNAGASGTANTGGGGGGSGGGAFNGGTGGSGIIIVRYLTSDFLYYNLQAYSESSIKTQGSYALKGVADQTNSLNKTLTRTIGSPINLAGAASANFDIRSTRTGSNIKIGIHDSGGTTTEITPNITSANTFQTVSWDLSAVNNANKDAIDRIIITIVNADAVNTFYMDNLTFVTPSDIVFRATTGSDVIFRAQGPATGGTITYTDSSGANPRTSPAYSGGYTVHTFTTSGTLEVNGDGNVSVLAVAGGGGGAGGGTSAGGGGGGLVYNSSFAVSPGYMSVTVGNGGTAGATSGDPRGGNGGDSVFGTITAVGGGGGGGGVTGGVNTYINGKSGGSGGGGAAWWGSGTGGGATSGQGNSGSAGADIKPSAAGGGGGAGSAGSTASAGVAGNGGTGLAYSISGNSLYYAGGGGGGAYYAGSIAGTGGSGVGGNGTVNSLGTPGNGLANRGGGGGGAGGSSIAAGGSGGSGVVIIRYLTSDFSYSGPIIFK